MKVLKRTLTLVSFTLLSAIAISQQNSPWEKFKEETINGVVVAPGCHQYSLTDGQGYSVYLKNANAYPVAVTGNLIAKTVCGKDVSTYFNVNLAPGETAAGSDFYNGSKTGQTAVTTAAECAGVKFSKNTNFIDRISNVRVSNVYVTPTGNTNINTNSGTVETAVTKSNSQINKSITTLDSTSYYKNLWSNTRDSLSGELYLLKNRNRELLDSLNLLATLPNLINTNNVSNQVLTNNSISNVVTKSNSLKPFDLLLQTGLGWDKLPLYVNNDSGLLNNLPTYGTSYTGSTSHPLLQIALLAKLFNQSIVNLELNPFASYGANIGSGVNSKHITYGIGANILASLSKKLPLKLVGIGNYTARNGNWNKAIENAEYDYNFLKFGGGLRYVINDGFWIQPNITFDKSSFAGSEAATVIGIESLIKNKISLGLNFSSKYINQGPIKYPLINNEDKGYFALRLLYNIGLLK